MERKLVIAFVIAALYFNLYKMEPIFSAWIQYKSYEFFPWMKNPVESLSSPIWLGLHNIVSIVHLVITSIFLLHTKHQQLIWFKYTHVVFSLLIMINPHHLGSLSSGVAMAINVGLVVGLSAILMCIDNLFYRPVIPTLPSSIDQELLTVAKYAYLIILSAPVIVEIVLYGLRASSGM